MAAQPTEERELLLLDKIDFRILAVANNEKKLTALLSSYLCPIIIKVTSDHKSVRDKVGAHDQPASLCLLNEILTLSGE